jgi:hypothetical protein
VTEHKFKSLFLVLLVALIGLVSVYLSWPRFQASFRFLPVDIAIERYHADREIPTHRILTLIGFAQQAISHHDHYRYRDGLSFLHYLRALDIYTPALERRGEYRNAESQALEAVKRAPAQPEAWLRIAVVRSILRDEPAEVLEPWKMSIYTGRTHSTLLVPRTSIGIPYADYMDTESRAMLRDQLLLAWAMKPNELLRELKQVDPGLEKTGILIGARDPAALAEMEVRIEKIR